MSELRHPADIHSDLVMLSIVEYEGQKWRVYLTVPLEFLESLPGHPASALEAYGAFPAFWRRLGDESAASHLHFLGTQTGFGADSPRRVWFQWGSLARLQEALTKFISDPGAYIRLSILACPPGGNR